MASGNVWEGVIPDMFGYTRGVHLPQKKEPAVTLPIADLQEVQRVLLPIALAGEAFAVPSRQRGEAVRRGEIAAQPIDKPHCPVFSPIDGIVAGHTTFEHPVYGEMTCLVVEGTEAGEPLPPVHQDASVLSQKELRELARLAGIVDELDGVPLHRKLRDWSELNVSCLVVDAVEGEPYGAAALGVLEVQARQVMEGLRLAQRACGAQEVRLSVRTSPLRVTALRRQVGARAVYAVHDATYPYEQIAPRRFRTVCRVGAQACLALFRAAGYTEPQTTMVVTVAGDAVARPQNVRVPIGTPAEAVLELCGLQCEPQAVVFGDALTGVAGNPMMPLLHGTTSLLALKAPAQAQERPCITCGRCAHACHKGLLPYEIDRLCRTMQYELLGPMHPEDCDACGACSYVCPARRDVMAHVFEATFDTGAVIREGDDRDE